MVKTQFGWWKYESSHTLNVVWKNSGFIVGPQPAMKEYIYNVMVSSEELIGTTGYLTVLDDMLHKPMSL